MVVLFGHNGRPFWRPFRRPFWRHLTASILASLNDVQTQFIMTFAPLIGVLLTSLNDVYLAPLNGVLGVTYRRPKYNL